MNMIMKNRFSSLNQLNYWIYVQKIKIDNQVNLQLLSSLRIINVFVTCFEEGIRKHKFEGKSH